MEILRKKAWKRENNRTFSFRGRWGVVNPLVCEIRLQQRPLHWRANYSDSLGISDGRDAFKWCMHVWEHMQTVACKRPKLIQEAQRLWHARNTETYRYLKVQHGEDLFTPFDEEGGAHVEVEMWESLWLRLRIKSRMHMLA